VWEFVSLVGGGVVRWRWWRGHVPQREIRISPTETAYVSLNFHEMIRTRIKSKQQQFDSFFFPKIFSSMEGKINKKINIWRVKLRRFFFLFLYFFFLWEMEKKFWKRKKKKDSVGGFAMVSNDMRSGG